MRYKLLARRLAASIALAFASWGPNAAAQAPPQAPAYEECRLDSIFPIGGRRGTSVRVTFKGFNGGLGSPRDIIIDGPPGLTAKGLKPAAGNSIEATIEIAADAPLGRRQVRVLNEKSGLTNFAYFVVGDLTEIIEAEPNGDVAKPQLVTTPTVVNGRIDPAADLDVFRFRGRKGEKCIAAIAAHTLDVHGQSKNAGIADFSLELLDAGGRTLAASEDAIGFDPLIERTLPADGDYFLRVQLLNYGGFPDAVYRLTLGEVPYVVGAFPAGYRRGAEATSLGAITLFGPNVPAGTTAKAGGSSSAFERDPAYPLNHVSFGAAGIDVPLVVGDLPERLEAEPNDERKQATEVARPITINGRFERAGDADWYRFRAAAGEKIAVETIAHRFIRSPVDTQIEVFDAAGKSLAENDDDKFEPGYESYHDFKTTDSKTSFTAPAAGEYFVRVAEQSGSFGPRAIYRLTIDEARPDFRISHFPDAIPVWGPGSTACVLVRVDRAFGFDEDVEIAVEDLPTGWSAAAATSLGGKGIRPYNTYQLKVFLTITAPHDAQPGTSVPLRIVGRAKLKDGTMLERGSLPLTLFYTSDTGFFRASPRSRVAVAKSVGPWLETDVREIKLAPGENSTITVNVRGAAGDLKAMPLVVNLATAGVACGLGTPQTIPIVGGKVEMPLKVPAEIAPGTYGIVVAQSWRSDIRIGMPGTCTPLIKLIVEPAKK